VSLENLSALIAIGIPVKDEAESIGNCLHALANQINSPKREVVLLLNNCEDATAEVVRGMPPVSCMQLHVRHVVLPKEQANAGHARRLAMEFAAELVGPHGILLTTDADSQVAPDWIEKNLSSLRQGADVVAGRADLDPADAARIPLRLHQDDARECMYADLVDEIDALIDPELSDPWPRHSEHSGASIAVTVDAYRLAGGIPAVALGEDRAFFESLRRVDARIRHAPEVRVTVSGRIFGRARGGMADTIRRRFNKSDDTLDDRLEPASDAFRRSLLRKYLRIGWHRDDHRDYICCFLSKLTDMRRGAIASVFDRQYFGEAWAELQDRSPVLTKRRVAVAELGAETAMAQKLLRFLRLAQIKGTESRQVQDAEARRHPNCQSWDGATTLRFGYKFGRARKSRLPHLSEASRAQEAGRRTPRISELAGHEGSSHLSLVDVVLSLPKIRSE
jgi:glycosyltransferase involved in cell wall biosynthesis